MSESISWIMAHHRHFAFPRLASHLKEPTLLLIDHVHSNSIMTRRLNRRQNKRDIDALTGRDHRIQQSRPAEGQGMIFFVKENEPRVKAGIGPRTKLPRRDAGVVHADSQRSRPAARDGFMNFEGFHSTAAFAGKILAGDPLPEMT